MPVANGLKTICCRAQKTANDLPSFRTDRFVVG